MNTRLPPSAFKQRITSIRNLLSESMSDAGIWFDAKSIEYLVGFSFVQTERPVALAVTDDTIAAAVPRLEVDRIQTNSHVEKIYDYFDYPQGDPLATVATMLDELDVKHVAADQDGAPGVMGYEGPPLSSFLSVENQNWVSTARRQKSTDEFDLIRESARWAGEANRELAEQTEIGAHPVIVSGRASTATSERMMSSLRGEYDLRSRGRNPAFAGMVHGENTALPHGYALNEPLSDGDTIVTGATANVGGYYAELERTMFVGEPSDEDEHYFELVSEAQEIAFEVIAPSVEASYVDAQVAAYFEEQGVSSLSRHHTGHNIGLEFHEPPYLDIGSDAVIKPGHVYAVEPGIYTDNTGYRHSDTLLIHEDSVERITEYPRDLASNIIS